MLLITVNFSASFSFRSHCSVRFLSFFFFSQYKFLFSLVLFSVVLPNKLSPLLHTVLRKWQLGKLNQSFNKAWTAVGFDKWGSWSGTVQPETEGHIGSRKINSSWSCWLPHFITFVSEFSACLQLFLPTNYSSCSPQAAAINPRTRSL